MDLISRVLALTPVSGRLEVRCHFGAPWVIDNAPAGVSEIPWHVLLAGEAMVESGDGPPQKMIAGDIVLFPGGDAHRLSDGSGKKAKPITERAGMSLMIADNKGKGEAVDILCGRFVLATAHDRLMRPLLPSSLVIHGGPSAGDGSGDEGSLAATRLARLVGLMREEAYDEAPGCGALLGHLSGALFALTLRFASETAEPPKGLLAMAREPRLQPALVAMFESPAEDWTLAALAELCFMSRATFVRHFDDALGQSAMDMLTEIRMTLAARQLRETRLSTDAVGEAVGYRSEAAFQRVFKRVVGVTPARWRAGV